MQLKVKSQADQMLKRFEEDLKTLSDLMQSVASSGVDKERSTHAYKNRTGTLEGSTQWGVESSSSLMVTTMRMGAPYASFVLAKGFSQFPGIVDDADKQITKFLTKMSNRFNK